MFDPKSDYALNKKDPDAIVYIDDAGTLTRPQRRRQDRQLSEVMDKLAE